VIYESDGIIWDTLTDEEYEIIKGCLDSRFLEDSKKYYHRNLKWRWRSPNPDCTVRDYYRMIEKIYPEEYENLNWNELIYLIRRLLTEDKDKIRSYMALIKLGE
jgi:hypothetical protein